MLSKLKANYLKVSKRMLVLMMALILLGTSLNSYVYDNRIEVNINVEGVTVKTVKTAPDTVYRILKDENIDYKTGDKVVPELSTKLLENSEISISKKKDVTLLMGEKEYSMKTTALTTREFSDDARKLIGEGNAIVVAETGLPGKVVEGGKYEMVEAFEVIVAVDGVEYSAMMGAGTVAEAIELSGANVDDNDAVSPSYDTFVKKGMKIEVTKLEVFAEEEFTEIPYEVEYRINKSLKVGQEVVTQEGEAGRVLKRTLITYDGDKAISYETEESVITEKKNKIVECGVWNIKRTDQNSGKAVGEINGYKYSKVIRGQATSYCDQGKTASGITSRVGVVAVDPRVIPLGTRLYIESGDGSWSYGVCLAGDTGGAVKGTIVDLFRNEYDECIQFGRRGCNIYILCD